MQIIEHPHTSVSLNDHIDRFSKATILVIGDIIYDAYVWGDVSRISPEAPVPVVEVKKETTMLGGAANVIRNISGLGAKAILCGVVGNDPVGRELIQMVRDLGLPTDGIVTVPDRRTSMKTRVVAHNQQVVRFDRESQWELHSETIQRLLHFIEDRLNGIDAVIVSDYGKGVISPRLMKGLRRLVEKSEKKIAVDPKTGNFEFYQQVDVITPNHHEAGAFCRFEIIDEKTLMQAGNHILHQLNCHAVLITRGKDGMTLFKNGGESFQIPTRAKKVFDVTGAGDTVIASLCVGLASGLDIQSAAILSNHAAGMVVGEVGTSTVKIADLKREINKST